MKLSTAKKLRLTKETLRTLSNADLRAVRGGTEAVASDPDATCIDVLQTESCVIESDGCFVDANVNVLIGVNRLRRV